MANFKIYQPFESTDIISGKTTGVSSGYFPGGDIKISQSFFQTSSAQTKLTGSNGIYDVLNGLYYTNVYNDSVTNPQMLFSISYGSVNGGGTSGSNLVFSSSAAIYAQYKNLLLGISDLDGLFSFKTGSKDSSTPITSSEIFVIAFSSDLMKDQIDRGQWSFTISGSNGSSSLSLIDEYPILTSAEQKEQRLVYQIISGSYDESTGQTSAGAGGDVYRGLGLFYPKNGIIVLNANKLAQYAGHSFNNTIGSTVINHQELFKKLKGAGNLSPAAFMRIRKTEMVPSAHYFIRVKNQDYNFSNNPSFVYQTTDENNTKGEIITGLQTDPKTYVTTVGLYNELNELIAVAKLSRPTRKDFTNELLIRVRLDF